MDVGAEELGLDGILHSREAQRPAFETDKTESECLSD